MLVYIYFLTPIGKYAVKRGEPIFPSVHLYRQCFNAFIAFPTSYIRGYKIKKKRKKTSSSIVIGLVYRQKGGIHHVMKMIENSFPAYRIVILLLHDTYIYIYVYIPPFTIRLYIKYNNNNNIYSVYLPTYYTLYEFDYYYFISFSEQNNLFVYVYVQHVLNI